MKKLCYVLAIISALILAFPAAACSPKANLSVPYGFSVNENYMLSWFGVPDARRYEVNIFDEGSSTLVKEMNIAKNNTNLSDLSEGSYSIRVRAVGGINMDEFSDWSEAFVFVKPYESGIAYGLINNNTEYAVVGVGSLGNEKKIVIDEEFRGKKVTEIANGAFRNDKNLNEIVLPDTIRAIGFDAFNSCSALQSINLPEGLKTIGYQAFRASGLTSVAFPDSLVSLGELAFSYCENLQSVDFGDGLERIEKSAFAFSQKLDNVVFSDALKEIGETAFANDISLKKISFGSGLMSIGSNAFLDCALTDISFKPLENECKIENQAFRRCDMKSVSLPDKVVAIDYMAFSDCENLETISIPDSVVSLGYGVIDGTKCYNDQVEAVEYDDDEETDPPIPAAAIIYADKWAVDVTEGFRIKARYLTYESDLNSDRGSDYVPGENAYAFKDDTYGIADYTFFAFGGKAVCSNLIDIRLSEHIKYIGVRAFGACPELANLRMYEYGDLKEIGDYAFAECGKLRRVYLYDGLEVIGNGAFYKTATENNENTPLTPKTLKRIGMGAFTESRFWNEQIDRKKESYDGLVRAGNWIVGYDPNVRDSYNAYDNDALSDIIGIADYAFFKNNVLSSININRVEHIGRNAFSHCTSLQSVTLNNDLEVIEPFTFNGCYMLQAITLPRELKTVGRYAFFGARLNSIDFSRTDVTSIGDHAFYACESLETVILSDELEEIQPYTFYQCSSLTHITIPDSVDTIRERAFAFCVSLTDVDFGNGVKRIDKYAFKDCQALSAIALPDSTVSVGDHAFVRCYGVKELSLGSSLAEIEDYAFSYLATLKSVTIPESVVSIGDSAFKGCSELRSVIFDGTPEYVGAHAFYACEIMSVFSRLDDGTYSEWDAMWNSYYRPLFKNTVFAEDENGRYVYSIVVGPEYTRNLYAFFGIADPYRRGYVLAGWTVYEGSDIPDTEILSAEEGTTLYAIWAEYSEPDIEEPDEEADSETDA